MWIHYFKKNELKWSDWKPLTHKIYEKEEEKEYFNSTSGWKR